MTGSLRTECPECRKPLQVTTASIGHRVRCPGCTTDFVISSVGFVGSASIVPSLVAVELGNAADERRTSPVMAPGRIGRFQLLSELGQGGFGRVYRAADPLLQRDVAVKIPRVSDIDAEQRERFLNEARRQLYVAMIRLAQEAWKNGNLEQMLELLNQARPRIGQADPREWEWYYLRGQARRPPRRTTNPRITAPIRCDLLKYPAFREWFPAHLCFCGPCGLRSRLHRPILQRVSRCVPAPRMAVDLGGLSLIKGTG